MTSIFRRARPLAAVALVSLSLAGCETFGGSEEVAVNTVGQPQQLQPLPNSNVNSSSLPPLQTSSQPAPGLSGTPQLGGVQPQTPNSTFGPVTSTTPGMTNVPSVTPGMTSVPSVTPGMANVPSTTPMTTASINPTAPATVGAPAAGARDLTGGPSVDKLTGTWTISSGPDQCRLNLTNTPKTGTQRYRASTPGCTISGLSAVASWSVAGTQVQLFDEAGKMIAAMVTSGNRFIGTSAGGAAISMAG